MLSQEGAGPTLHQAYHLRVPDGTGLLNTPGCLRRCCPLVCTSKNRPVCYGSRNGRPTIACDGRLRERIYGTYLPRYFLSCLWCSYVLTRRSLTVPVSCTPRCFGCSQQGPLFAEKFTFSKLGLRCEIHSEAGATRFLQLRWQ